MNFNPGIAYSEVNRLPVIMGNAAGVAAPVGSVSDPIFTGGSRAFSAKSATAIPNAAASYAAGKAIGGLITIATGLPGGTVLTVAALRIKCGSADMTATGATNYHIFDASPSGATVFTDGSSGAIAAADYAKMISFAAASWVTGTTGTVNLINVAIPARITLDANGNFYVGLIASATVTFANANALLWQVDGTC